MEKDTSINNGKTVSLILSLITLCVGLHYFFSLNFLIDYLASFDLSFISILSFEDVQFIMASFNIKLLVLLISSIIVIPLTITRIDIKLNREKEKRASNKKFINVRAYLVTIIFCLFLTYYYTKPWMAITSIVIANLILYYFTQDKWLSIICAVFLVFIFVYSDIRDITKHNPLFNNYVKFELSNGKTIVSDNKDHRLIFFGAKYVILQNGKNSVNLYPTSEIREVEWSELVYSIETN